MIPQAFIDEIQARTDISEVISSYIPLKRAGRNFKALCPFHGEKTPSFLVSPQKQIFHCFGCGEGGGAIQFIMRYEKVTFVEAIEMLANRMGVEVPNWRGEKDKIKTVLYDVVQEACSFFHRNLLDAAASPVLTYLSKRNIGKEAVEKFCLGYAPGKNTLLNYLREKKFPLSVLEQASLVIGGSSGFRDFFVDRIIFPIGDVRSKVVGFGARMWQEKKDAPKYINSLETSIYSKRAHLFGLNFSKDDILKNDCAIIVEGYLDMITPFMAGVRNIAASLGTALTLEQIRLIKRYTANVVLIFDADPAGQRAALRALDPLLENDLKVKIVTMPPGFDPDSLVGTKGRDYFLERLAKKEDFFDYKMEVLSAASNIKTIEGKTRIAQEMLATLEKVNNEIERHEYIKKLAGRLGVSEEAVINEFKRGAAKNKDANLRRYGSGPAARGDQPLVSSASLSIAEKVLIKYMLTNKKALFLIKDNLLPADFTSAAASKVAAYFFSKAAAPEDFSLPKIIGAITDEEISRFVSKILMDEQIPCDKEFFRGSLMKLQRRRVLQAKAQLKEDIKQAEINGDRERLKDLMNKYAQVNSEVRNG